MMSHTSLGTLALPSSTPYHKLNDGVERQTLDAGFEKALGPKGFRRGAANATNGMFAVVNWPLANF